MKEYSVKWDVQLDGQTPVEAALAALSMHRDPLSTATVFSVASADGVVTVDLDEQFGETLPYALQAMAAAGELRARGVEPSWWTTMDEDGKRVDHIGFRGISLMDGNLEPETRDVVLLADDFKSLDIDGAEHPFALAFVKAVRHLGIDHTLSFWGEPDPGPTPGM